MATFVLMGTKASLAARPLVIDDVAPYLPDTWRVEFGVFDARLRGRRARTGSPDHDLSVRHHELS